MSGLHSATLDDGRSVQVDYTVSSWGSNQSWDHPGDPVEVDLDAWICGDALITPTDAEWERVAGEIIEILEREGPPPLDDDV